MHRKLWSEPIYILSAKLNIHGSKLLLCNWWNQLNVFHYEVLKLNEAVTGDHYQLQLMPFNQALKGKMAVIQAET